MTQAEEGDLEIMCNLGEGLYEDGKMKGRMEGRAEGRAQGRTEKQLESALEMLKDGVSFEKIAQYTKLSLSKIKELAKQNKLI